MPPGEAHGSFAVGQAEPSRCRRVRLAVIGHELLHEGRTPDLPTSIPASGELQMADPPQPCSGCVDLLLRVVFSSEQFLPLLCARFAALAFIPAYRFSLE
jgi:hypothetical protein